MSIARIPILRHGQSVWDKELIPESEIARRLERVRRMMSEAELDLLVVYGDMLNSGNLAYLTNFHSFDARMPGIALVSATELDAILKVTSRALFYIGNFVWCRMHSCDFLGGDLAHKLGDLVSERKLANKSVGFVGGRHAPEELMHGIAEVFSAGSVNHVDQRFEALRRDKSLAERCLLRLAAAKAESVLTEVIDQARPGMSETALAALADYAARSAGCQDAEFLVYTADELAPPRWGYEHFPFRPPAPRALPLKNGVGLFVAVQYFGYWAELSQTLFLAEPRAVQRAACELARACFEEMLEVARRSEGDRAQWRDGTRSLWIHGTGLDREEAPYWSRSGDTLAEGDVLAAHVAAKHDGEVVFIGRPVAVSQGRAATLCEAAGLTLLPGSPGLRGRANRDARLA
jgi:Xaa-Pro aminopeptidase